MEPADRTLMTEPPDLIKELIRMLQNMPYSNVWTRLRIAMTEEELEQYREYMKASRPEQTFARAIRGTPIIIENAPDSRQIIVELTK